MIIGDDYLQTVYLCGFMGCGKTTIGRKLAEKLLLPYTDMDEYITQKYKMSVPQIFEQKGEDFFRQAETDAIAELAGIGGVISCGGGAMLRQQNADIANKSGTVVYIDVNFETCYARICNDKNRPIVATNSKEQLFDLYNTRSVVYMKNSKIHVSGEDTSENIVKLIIAELSA